MGAEHRRRTAAEMDTWRFSNLIARTAFALDTACDTGYTYADLFTNDGECGMPKWGEQLAALDRTGSRRPSCTCAIQRERITSRHPRCSGDSGTRSIDFEPGGGPPVVLDQLRQLRGRVCQTPIGLAILVGVLVTSHSAVLRSSSHMQSEID